MPPLPASGLPPRGDPRRPVLLAVRSMRVIFVLLLLPTAFGVWQTLKLEFRLITASVLLRNIGVWAIPALVYLVCILGLLERRPGVVVFALAWTGLHLAFNTYLFAAMALAAYRGAVSLGEPTAKVGLAIAGLWVVAIGQLEWHLAQSIKGIRYDMAGHADAGAEPAGFDVVQR